MTTTTTTEVEFRVWIGCLSCYNGGDLVGQWYPAIEAGDVTTEALHEEEANRRGHANVGQDYSHHEELWCFDIEAPISAWAREMSPMEAAKLAGDFEEATDALSNCPAEAYLQWLGNRGEEPSWDTAYDAEDRYRGNPESFRDYADELADEMLGVPATPCPGSVWDMAMREAGERIEFAVRYFDYAAHARDMEHYYTVLDAEQGVYVFDASY